MSLLGEPRTHVISQCAKLLSSLRAQCRIKVGQGLPLWHPASRRAHVEVSIAPLSAPPSISPTPNTQGTVI